ncbi:MAG: acyltransferase family protein [Candidatus Latescibacteria bacterium]|nr:acyltransferase family protein [Candidatus Latescibacterota bacterium]
MTANTSSNRLIFFDHVRYIVIIWMTLFHVASGLAGHQEFIRDSNTSFVFVIFHGYSVTVMMAIMFFAAGYFSTPSQGRRSMGAFVKSKLLRLGLPWLVGVVLLGPTMPYLAYYSRSFAGLQTPSYWDFWLRYMGSIWTDWLLPISFTANTVFHHQHFWFLSVLFVYFAVHALLRAARRRWGWPAPRPVSAGPISQWDFARAFLLTALAIVLGMASSRGLGLPSGTFAFFFTFNSLAVFLYGPIFALAIYAHWRGWYASGQAPGWKAAGFVFAGLLVAAGAAAGVFFTLGQQSPLLMFFGMSAFVLVNLLSVLGFTSLIFHYLNKPSAVHANFAANSYNVYLVQYPVILVFRLMNFTWEASPFLKFVTAAIPALLVSYALSQFLIRPRPRLAILVAVGLHAGLCLFALPRTSFSHLLLDRQSAMQAVLPATDPEPLLPAAKPRGGGPPGPGGKSSLAWQDGMLYYGSGTGLQVLHPDGHWESLVDTLSVNGLAPLGGGRLAVAGSNWLALWDVEEKALRERRALDNGTLDELVTDGRGGFFYSLAVDEQYTLTHQQANGQALLTEQSVAGAGALNTDGQTLLWTTADKLEIQTFALDTANGLAPREPFGEIFMADGKYGRPRPQPIDHTASGMTVDRQGRLFVVNRVGLQVFDPQGQLLGVVQFPAQPFDCAFGGDDLATLYVATSDQVYALATQTAGVAPK